ncbi:MAG: hypothetical protein RL108_70 [Bacteroidota bacterium]|jgi:hypothetical protein
MKTIVLISCGNRKKKTASKACELYIGALFVNSLNYARHLNPDAIYILSALHHLLTLEQVIKPYDVTLSYISKSKKKPGLIALDKKEKQNWGYKVLYELGKVSDLQNDNFIILAGTEYVKPIENGMKNIKNLLERKRIGEMIKFLKNNLN